MIYIVLICLAYVIKYEYFQVQNNRMNYLENQYS